MNFFGITPASGTTVVAHATPEDEHIEFRKEDLDSWHKLFRQFDANKDGVIDLVEFAMICDRSAKERGDPPRDETWIARAFKEADKDGSGAIDFREYVMVTHKHKATVDPMFADNSTPAAKIEREHAQRAARLVTSVPVLRETLELAKRSKDPHLVREAARLLYALGDAGKPTLAGIVFAEGEQMVAEKLRSNKAGGRANYAALAEIGMNAATNAIDAAVVRDQITQQQGAGATDPNAIAQVRSLRTQTMWTDICAAIPSAHDLETVFSYFQFQGLTNMLAIAYVKRFPEFGYSFDLPPLFTSWQLYLGWMNIFNMDLQAVASWVSSYDLPPVFETFSELPYASTYLLVTAALPLSLSFINLILFYPLYQVLWIFITVLSLALALSAGLAIGVLDTDRLAVVGGGTLSPEFLNTLLYIGIGVFAAMVVAALGYRFYLTHRELQQTKGRIDLVAKNMGRADTVALRSYLEGKVDNQGPPPPLKPWIYARNLAVTVICIFFATFNRWSRLLKVGRVLEIVLGCFAIVTAIYNAATFSQQGRIYLRKLSILIDQVAVSAFLLLLSILYMPVTRMLFAVWLSDSKVCPPGTRFPQFSAELSASSAQWLASGVVLCEPCEFASFSKAPLPYTVNYETGGQCAAQFCPGETSVRSFQDPRLSYFEMILPFFGPASLLMLLGFTLGVPYLYYMIITRHTKMFNRISVHSSRVVIEKRKKHQGDVEWDYRVSGSRNRGKSLYSIFEYQFRYMKLVIVLQKLLIIAVVIFLYEFLVAAALTVSILHFVYMCYQVYYRPYFDPKSDWLSISVTFASAANPLIIVLTDYGVVNDVPVSAVSAVILLINFGLPVLVLGLGWICSIRHRKALAEKEDNLEKNFTEAEILKIEKERRMLDEELNRVTLKYVLRVFVVMAFTGFLAVALLLLGQFWQAATSEVVAPTSPELGTQLAALYAKCEIEELMFKNELSDYTSWQEFTQNCCCSDRQNRFAYGDEFETGVTELWTCQNGFFKERYRKGFEVVRDFCSPVFNSGFSVPSYDEKTFQLVVVGQNDTFPFGW